MKDRTYLTLPVLRASATGSVLERGIGTRNKRATVAPQSILERRRGAFSFPRQENSAATIQGHPVHCTLPWCAAACAPGAKQHRMWASIARQNRLPMPFPRAIRSAITVNILLILFVYLLSIMCFKRLRLHANR